MMAGFAEADVAVAGPRDESPPPARFRFFLRALAEEIDSQAGPDGRDALLRGVGRQMAQRLPLPSVGSLEELELEMNELLQTIGWGRTQLILDEAERSLVIRHSGLPFIGSKGEPHGYWLGAALEGLYETWMGQQPGADGSLTARRQQNSTTDAIELRYRRI